MQLSSRTVKIDVSLKVVSPSVFSPVPFSRKPAFAYASRRLFRSADVVDRRDLSRRETFRKNHFIFTFSSVMAACRDLRDTFLCLHVKITEKFSRKTSPPLEVLKINVSIVFSRWFSGDFSLKLFVLKRNQLWWTLSDVNGSTHSIHSLGINPHDRSSRASCEKNFLVNKWFPVILRFLNKTSSQREIKLISIKSADWLEVVLQQLCCRHLASTSVHRTHGKAASVSGRMRSCLMIIYDQLRT